MTCAVFMRKPKENVLHVAERHRWLPAWHSRTGILNCIHNWHSDFGVTTQIGHEAQRCSMCGAVRHIPPIDFRKSTI